MLATIFIVLLIVAIFELAQVFTTYLVLATSAREGTLYATKYDPGTVDLDTYRTRIRRGLDERGVDPAYLQINDPTYTKFASDPDRYEIKVRVEYELSTLFSSSIALPMFGRMGLPTAYPLSYTMTAETRSW